MPSHSTGDTFSACVFLVLSSNIATPLLRILAHLALGERDIGSKMPLPDLAADDTYFQLSLEFHYPAHSL